MAQVADFVTFSDDPRNITRGGDIDFTLQENIAEVPQAGEGGLLTWTVRRNDPGSIEYEVFLNGGSRQNRYVVSSPGAHSVQEVVGIGKIGQGQNVVRFVATDGEGQLSVSDITLWYRKNV